MRLLSFKVPKNFNLFMFGDNHIGARLRHGKGFRKLVSMIKSSYEGCKKNYGIDHGDIIEAITIDDPRFTVFDTLEASILGQMEMVRQEYWPIRNNLLVIMDGNHTFKLHKFGNITKKCCEDLGVKYGTYSCKISFYNNKDLLFKLFCTHGAGSINSVADDPERRKLNWRLSLKRKLRDMAGDALIQSCGHTHKLIYSPPTKALYLTDNGKYMEQHVTEGKQRNYIHPDYRHYINTGSFLKVYGDNLIDDDKVGSGYAERAMYPPLPMGFYIAMVRNGKISGVNEVQV